MSRRRTALAAALSLLPLGQPLLLGTLGITTATTAIVLLHAPAVIAQDASAVARIAKAITVRIEGATQGSGVLVKREGDHYTVLTAWHLVSGNRPGEELAIFTPDGKEHQLEQGSIQRLGQVDMAVLTFSSGSAYEVASIGDIKKVKHDQPIYVAGFPLNNSQTLRYETGEVVANAEVGIDQGYQLLYDNKTESGMSGGVLLNADGELVGLHGRGERNEQASSGKALVQKTGVNQGVPITFYNLFISGEPVVVAKTTASTADDYLAQARASAGIKGREKTVIRLAEQSLKLRESAEGYFLVGTNKYNSGDIQGAIADFDKAIEIDPTFATIYSNRGAAKSELGDHQGAIADFNKAIAINPQFADAYSNRGAAKRKSGDYQGEIADYNKAIEIDPQYAPAYSNRGNAKRKSGDNQGAIADYNKSIATDPQLDAAYNNRGIVKMDLGDYKGAISDTNKALAINPEFADAYYNRGNAKQGLKDYQGAIADYSKAIAIDPQYAKAYLNRGTTKDDLGDSQGAIADFNKALAINPQLADAYNNRGNAKSELGDHQGAIADYNKAIAINPQYAGAYSNRGGAKRKSGDYQGAIADYNKAIAINPQYVNAYYNSGVAKGKSGDYQGAIADYSKAIAINPQYVNAYSNRGSAKGELGDYQGAIADYNMAIAIDPQDAAAYFNRGIAKGIGFNDVKGACSDFRKASSLGATMSPAIQNKCF